LQKNKKELKKLADLHEEMDAEVTEANSTTNIRHVFHKRDFTLFQLDRVGYVGQVLSVSGFANQLYSEYLQLDAYLLRIPYIYKSARHMEHCVLAPEFKKRLVLLGLPIHGDFITVRNRFYMHVFNELPHPKRALPKVMRSIESIQKFNNKPMYDFFRHILEIAHGPSNSLFGDMNDPDFRKALKMVKMEHTGDPAVYKGVMESALSEAYLTKHIDTVVNHDFRERLLFSNDPHSDPTTEFFPQSPDQKAKIAMQDRLNYPWMYIDYTPIVNQYNTAQKSLEAITPEALEMYAPYRDESYHTRNHGRSEFAEENRTNLKGRAADYTQSVARTHMHARLSVSDPKEIDQIFQLQLKNKSRKFGVDDFGVIDSQAHASRIKGLSEFDRGVGFQSPDRHQEKMKQTELPKKYQKIAQRNYSAMRKALDSFDQLDEKQREAQDNENPLEQPPLDSRMQDLSNLIFRKTKGKKKSKT